MASALDPAGSIVRGLIGVHPFLRFGYGVVQIVGQCFQPDHAHCQIYGVFLRGFLKLSHQIVCSGTADVRAEYQQLIAAEAEQAVAVEDLSEACAAAEDQGVPCLVALCVVHLLQAGDVSVYHSQAL